MPNKRYLAGRRFEWKIKKDLEKYNWIVLRSSGSKGLFDLIALNTHLMSLNKSGAKYAIEVDFWQLKKNITEGQALKIMRNIQLKTLGLILPTEIKQNSAGNYKQLFSEFPSGIVNIKFGVIYTLPKKKKT
jgi:Holliday junction resolvase